MFEITVEHLGEFQFEIEARGHKVICDQPVESGGYDEGMTPPEFLLASLGSCAGFYAAEYLRLHKLADSGVRVRVTAGKAKGPSRMDDFKISIEVPVKLDGKHQEGVEKAVHRCLVHNTLLHPPKIGISVSGSEAGSKQPKITA